MNESRAIVFFDGSCLLCAGVVRWIHRFDRKGKIWYAALEGDFAAQHREALALPLAGENADTFVFWRGSEGVVYLKGDGALELLKELSWGLRILGQLISCLPKGLRETGYDWIARNRYQWFGRSEQCTLPPESLLGKVLP